MTFQIGCILVSCFALAVLFLMLDKRVTRLEKLASHSLRMRVIPHESDKQ